MGAGGAVKSGRRGLVLFGSLGLALVGVSDLSGANARDGAGPLLCLSIGSEPERLACYDREVRKLVPPRFEGRLHTTTDRFLIEQPTRLRYQSDGAIFVLYLKSANGEVMQNLHLGGGGEASHLIEQPGTYFLDVNGSESWRIWLETEPTQSTN